MSSSRTLKLALGLTAASSLVAAAPCDIYASGNTPCVAAHSTTRALFSAYSGALYTVQRGSDSTALDIKPASAGGIARASDQDKFCANTTCTITKIYDQTSQANHLTLAPAGGAASGTGPNGIDEAASAVGAPIKLNGQTAYGVFVSPGVGYRNDATHGIAINDAAEGMYAVLDGTHYNDGCCFDYGNAETSNTDTGDGHMEAIYYGDNTFWGSGSGSGPWIMADLENGLFSGQNPKQNTGDPTITNRFVTAVVKGEANQWAIRGGNGASGALSTYYSGARPSGYNPMKKEGAIILGIGGDNSISGQGTFYEGVMTRGYPSDATENSVQANIVAAKYTAVPLTSGPAISVGSSISFRATTAGYNTRYLAHNASSIVTEVVSSSSSSALKKQASWTVRTGLSSAGAAGGCVSFESNDTPGSYIRHSNFQLQLQASDGSKQFGEDATFCPETAFTGQGTNAIRAWGYPTRYFRHYNDVGYIASNGGYHTFDAAASFNDDATWAISNGFA